RGQRWQRQSLADVQPERIIQPIEVRDIAPPPRVAVLAERDRVDRLARHHDTQLFRAPARGRILWWIRALGLDLLETDGQRGAHRPSVLPEQHEVLGDAGDDRLEAPEAAPAKADARRSTGRVLAVVGRLGV